MSTNSGIADTDPMFLDGLLVIAGVQSVDLVIGEGTKTSDKKGSKKKRDTKKNYTDMAEEVDAYRESHEHENHWA